MFTQEQYENFSLGELALVRQQLKNEEIERQKFIEKMFESFSEDYDTFCEKFDESVDYDDIDCF